MKLDEIITKKSITENEDFSDLASQALSDPATDELGRQKNKISRPGPLRTPYITLKHIHKLKLIKAARIEEFEKRKLLMGLMYAVPEKEDV